MTHMTLLRTLTFIGAASVSWLQATAAESTSAPIVLQKQGSFAVGGSVVTAPGTFDPLKHGAFNPAAQESAGQTLRGDHAYVFYQVPVGSRHRRHAGYFSMRATPSLVPALANNVPTVYQHRAYHGVGRHVAAAQCGQLQTAVHVLMVNSFHVRRQK